MTASFLEISRPKWRSMKTNLKRKENGWGKNRKEDMFKFSASSVNH